MSRCSIQNIIPLPEPVRGQNAMIALNNRVVQHEFLVRIIPFTADIFVFTYPVYLVWLYIYGIVKREVYYKEAALAIFLSSVTVTITNIIIQFFVDKSRPEEAITNKSQLILDHLPTEPFPSDHAAVSAAIAMATLVWGIKNKDKTFMQLSIFFWFACLAMSFSRVAVAVHRPTDVLAGIGVGILVSLILLSRSVWSRVVQFIVNPLITFEKWLFEKLFNIKQN